MLGWLKREKLIMGCSSPTNCVKLIKNPYGYWVIHKLEGVEIERRLFDNRIDAEVHYEMLVDD